MMLYSEFVSAVARIVGETDTVLSWPVGYAYASRSGSDYSDPTFNIESYAFSDLHAVLIELCPSISITDYAQLSALLSSHTTTDNDYYSSGERGFIVIEVVRLFDFLTAKGYIE